MGCHNGVTAGHRRDAPAPARPCTAERLSCRRPSAASNRSGPPGRGHTTHRDACDRVGVNCRGECRAQDQSAMAEPSSQALENLFIKREGVRAHLVSDGRRGLPYRGESEQCQAVAAVAGRCFACRRAGSERSTWNHAGFARGATYGMRPEDISRRLLTPTLAERWRRRGHVSSDQARGRWRCPTIWTIRRW